MKPADDESQHDMKIRAATLQDLPALVAIEQACFAIPWSEQSLRADLLSSPPAFLWVAVESDQQITGYIACYRGGDHIQINNLAVLPPYRHQGIGRLLIESLFAWARSESIQSADLEVRPSNHPAKLLYEACGFKEVGRRPRYYEDNGEDAIIMLKNLS